MYEKNQKTKFQSRIEFLKLYCAFQERTAQDVRIKAHKAGMKKPEIDKAINILQNDGFLDEQRYVEAFVRGKLKYNHWGKIKIKAELRAKAISVQVTEDCLKAIDADEYINVLRNVISKKGVTLQQSDSEDQFARLLRFGLSKGFEYDLVIRVVNEFLKL